VRRTLNQSGVRRTLGRRVGRAAHGIGGTSSVGRLELLAALTMALVPGFAQYPASPEGPGSIQGRVVAFSSGQPMARVEVTLTLIGDPTRTWTALTGRDGHFHFTGLPAGRYTITAARAGFLAASYAETPGTRLPLVFPLLPGEELKGLVIRLRRGSVVSGSVSFPDGEPAVGIPVEVYREYHHYNRHGYTRVTSAQTDDRGMYRIYGLPAGQYYLMALYQPGARLRGLEPAPEHPQPIEAIVPTFYPDVYRPAEAVPVRVKVEDEVSAVNITLAQAPVSSLRGEVIDGTTGERLQGATIRLLQSGPRGKGWIPVPVTLQWLPTGEFEVFDLVPGEYLVVAEATRGDQPLSGRRTLTVAGGTLVGWRLMVEPHQHLQGRVIPEDGTGLLAEGLRVILEPRTTLVPSSAAAIESDGSFSVPFVPGETYDIFLQGGPPNAYLKAARVGGLDVMSSGFRTENATVPVAELVYSLKGARIRGEVSFSPTRVALGATVWLIPNPARGRIQYYQATTTNQFGLYEFQGVAPGRYTLLAWWDEPPCQMYDPEDLGNCYAIGTEVEVREGEEKFVSLRLVPSTSP